MSPSYRRGETRTGVPSRGDFARSLRTLLLLASTACRPSDGASGSSAGAAAADDGPAPPRLLLVTFDTTRADRIGCYGDSQARTPCVDALAARGVLYERAWAPAPITLSSHATILTGAYPCAHGARENGAFEITPEARLLSEVLRDEGFKTGAFVGAFVLDRKFGLDQGFDVYDVADASRLGGVWGVIERPAGQVAEAAIRFIDTLAASDRYFLWVHFYDPHYPYSAPPEATSGEATHSEATPANATPANAASESLAYSREITYCDRELSRILERLRGRELDRGLVTVVTSDHGESLGEHSEKTHGIFVYEATMRVPLVIAPPPEGVAPGTRVRAPVSLADLAPTLLERMGTSRAALPDARTPTLPSNDDAEPEDGVGNTAAGDPFDRALYLESLTPFYSHRQHPLRAVIWKDMKYVESRRPELYSLRDDPREERDLAAARPELVQPLAQRLAALIAEHPPLRAASTPASQDGDSQRNIRELGYAGATADGDPFGEPDLPDPKDRIGDLDLMDRIVANVRDGSALLGLDGAPTAGIPQAELERRRDEGRAKLAEALALVEQLRAANPKDPMVPTLLSTIHLGLGNYPEAVIVLEKVVSTTPHNPTNHYNLSHAYARTGHPKWAKRELEKVVHLEPRSLFALRTLIDYAIAEKDLPAAAWWLDLLAKCPGQLEGDLAEVAKTRAQVQRQLDVKKESPRAPLPIGESDLLPEGTKKPHPGSSK